MFPRNITWNKVEFYFVKLHFMRYGKIRGVWNVLFVLTRLGQTMSLFLSSRIKFLAHRGVGNCCATPQTNTLFLWITNFNSHPVTTARGKVVALCLIFSYDDEMVKLDDETNELSPQHVFTAQLVAQTKKSTHARPAFVTNPNLPAQQRTRIDSLLARY